MPASDQLIHQAPQLSPAFPTPERFKAEKLRYAKVRVLLGGAESIGDLVPQYREGNQLGVRIEVFVETVFTSGNQPVSWEDFSEAGYVRVKDFYLSEAGIHRIKWTGDAKVPYEVNLDPVNRPPVFEPLLTNSSDPV